MKTLAKNILSHISLSDIKIALPCMVAAIVVCFIIILVLHNLKRPLTKPVYIIRKILSFATFLMIITTITSSITVPFVDYQIKAYGAYTDESYDYTKEDITTLWYRMTHSLRDQSKELPEDKSGCIIILYRWGCDDCENAREQLYRIIQDNTGVYAISTRSELGKSLVEKYSIIEVPAAIYIENDAKNKYTKKYLVQKNKFDETQINRLFKLRDKK